MIRFICSGSLVLLFLIGPYRILAQTSDKLEKADAVDSKVLEERIKQNKERTQVQLEAIEKEVEIRNNAVKQELERRTIELENRMDLYIWGCGIFLVLMGSLITFMGRKTIANWIRQTIEAKTIDELEAVWKDRMSTLDKDRGEYERLMSSLKDKIEAIDISKPLLPGYAADIASLGDKREKLKDEVDYSFDDWLYKGIGEYEKGRYAEAIISWTKALEIDPNSVSIHYNIGTAHHRLENYQLSIESYNKAIQLDPQNAHAYNNRGVTYKKLKEYEKAIEDYTNAIELNEKDAVAYNNRASSYYYLKEYEKALADSTKAIELDPKYAFAYNNRGIAYYSLNEYDEATRDFNKAIELDPGHTGTYINLAELMIIIGKYDDALQYLNRAMALGTELRDKAVCLYLTCIARKLLQMNTFEIEGELDKILEKDFEVDYSFFEINRWLQEVDLSVDTKRFIIAKADLLKRKMGGQ